MSLFVISDVPYRTGVIKLDLEKTTVSEAKTKAHSALKLEKDVSAYTYSVARFLEDVTTLEGDNKSLQESGVSDNTTIILSLAGPLRKVSKNKPEHLQKEEKVIASGSGEEVPSDTNEENVLSRIEKAKGELRKKLLEWVDAKAKSVLDSKSFIKISKPLLVELLKRDTLGAAEIDLFEACLRWAATNGGTKEGKIDNEEQKKVLTGVLQYIRFPLVNPQQLASKIVPLNILPSDVTLALFTFVATREAGQDPALPTVLEVYGKVPRKPPGPKPLEFINRAGIPIYMGTRGEGRSRFYCNRTLGVDAIPDSDGTCGPNDGPQCPDCKAFVLVNKLANVVTYASRTLKWYCSKPRQGGGMCGPVSGPQCNDCRELQRAIPKYRQQAKKKPVRRPSRR